MHFVYTICVIPSTSAAAHRRAFADVPLPQGPERYGRWTEPGADNQCLVDVLVPQVSVNRLLRWSRDSVEIMLMLFNDRIVGIFHLLRRLVSASCSLTEPSIFPSCSRGRSPRSVL